MWGLENFGFRALWSPLFLLLITGIAAVYLLAVGPYRHRFKNSEPVSNGKKSVFLIGLFIFYIAQGGPLDLLGHLIFSAHMMAMALAYLVVPPLILLGLPAWLVQPLFSNRKANSVFRKITHPILTLVLFNMLFSLYHIPLVLDYVMTHYFVHFIYFSVLFISAFMMWWNVICPVPEMDCLSDVRKMGYIFANGMLLTPACALIIFAGSTVYGTYSDPNIWARALGYCVPQSSSLILENFQGPSFFALLDPLEDQQLGGIIMKLMQEFMYGTVLFIIFNRWYYKENPVGAVDPIK